MENVQKIVLLYQEINNIYMELYGLEYAGKKGEAEFIELVVLLNQLVMKERELFAELYGELDGVSYMVIDDGSSFSRRMIDYINFYEAQNIPIYEDDCEEEIIDKVYDMKYAKLYQVCSKNVFLVYLSFLQECIDSETYISIRDKFLSYKYYNAFINHDVEECLIERDFEIERVNFISLYFIAESLGIDVKMCDNIILDCFKDTIEITVNQILAINDTDYNDDDKKAISINNQSMLRAALSLMNRKDYEENKEWLFKMINGLVTTNNNVSLNIINSIVDGIVYDRGRVRKISWRQIDN